MNFDRHSVIELLREGTRLIALAGPIVLVGQAGPSAQDVGLRGPSFAGAGPTPTETKSQSKLWFNDGSWWGSLWSSAGQAFHIHRLDADTATWNDTGTEIDARPNSHSDVLWDGSALYVASHEFTEGSGSPGEPLRIYRFGYDPSTGVYTLDTGFPVDIGDSSTEALVIDKDSTGTLWAVWMEGLRVRMSHTMGDDSIWSSPVVLPANTTDVGVDDICSVIHFGGDRIGVMWSDHSREEFSFSTHLDGAPADDWSLTQGLLPGRVDDHINLAADGAGRLFAVVKTVGDEILLAVRTAGAWQDFLVGTSSLTRPIVLLNEESRTVHVFARSVGTIFEKTSSMDAIDFPSGPGTVVMEDDNDPLLNNPTSTKQNVDSSTGVVVLAAHESSEFYWSHQSDATAPPGGGGGGVPGPNVSFYNGSGINADAFSSPGGPRIGREWRSMVPLGDANQGVVFVGLGGQAPPGTILDGVFQGTELLCLPPYVVMSTSVRDRHRISVPDNPALIDMSFALQAGLIHDDGSFVLQNALIVSVGPN